jgi:DNA invertase Pin-like site-specific DNA recombinase
MHSRKHAVETVEMLDFLKEIVEPIPDPSAGGTIDLDSEEAQANAENQSKKRRSTKGKAASAKATAEGGEPAPKKRRKKKTDTDAIGEEIVFTAGGPADSDVKGEVNMEGDDED